MMLIFLLVAAFIGKLQAQGEDEVVVEEFFMHNPLEFHNNAMSAFMEMRRKDPSVNLSYDGPLLKRGNEHAIKRMRRRPEEELTLSVRLILIFPFVHSLLFCISTK
jgi:hypothetical protein